MLEEEEFTKHLDTGNSASVCYRAEANSSCGILSGDRWGRGGEVEDGRGGDVHPENLDFAPKIKGTDLRRAGRSHGVEPGGGCVSGPGEGW